MFSNEIQNMDLYIKPRNSPQKSKVKKPRDDHRSRDHKSRDNRSRDHRPRNGKSRDPREHKSHENRSHEHQRQKSNEKHYIRPSTSDNNQNRISGILFSIFALENNDSDDGTGSVESFGEFHSPKSQMAIRLGIIVF